jgi:DNA-binding transcriptional MerR regulator
MEAAERLGVSPGLIYVWITQGVLDSSQRTARSYRWVRLNDSDVARLKGEQDWSAFPTVRQVMQERQVTREQVWAWVRAGEYEAYRQAAGQRWEWRLRRRVTEPVDEPSSGA